MHEHRRFWDSYAVAVAATAAAVFVRWLLNPLLDHRLPFITLYGAVAVAVWHGGWRPALLATILGYIASDLAFVETEPDAPLSLQGPGGLAGLAVYLFSCLIVITLGSGMRTAQRRSEAAALEALAKQKQLENEMGERQQAEQALRDNETRLAAEAKALARLNELSSRLWRMRSLREGLDEMLAATIELLGADKGNVQILDAERGVLCIAAQRGFEQDFLDFFREVSTEDDSACGRALRSGQRMVIEDVEADPPYAPLRSIARAAGYRGVQSTPLIGRDGTPLGMLSTHFRSVHRPGEQDLRRLDLYARQAADFIERCRSDEKLQEADRRKDEFLATLAHELRNPLAPVRNAVQLLRLKGPPNGELQWAREVIDRQIQQMARLIDDLMDVSRITRGRLELRRERIELAKVLQAAVETSRPLIDGSGHELTVSPPPDPVYLDADLTRLAQVFSNLLNNAAKYSERSSRIFLTAERQGSDVVVSVRDNGIGMPQEILPHIFEMFAQMDRSLERSRGGLGIGLTLVKRLVEMHGGNVEARSDGPGKGSEFIVRLPIPIEHTPRKPEAKEHDEPAVASERLRILLADDNKDAATSLSMLLDLLGYETRTAYDGSEALKAAAEFRPDVALLDIGMPKMNGYDVARRIREQPWGEDIVLIAVTGWGQTEDQQRSLEAGFDHHLVKPVAPSTIANLLVAGRPDCVLAKR